MQFLRLNSTTNNNRWTSWLFIVLWSNVPQRRWPGVYTGRARLHAETAFIEALQRTDHRKDTLNNAHMILSEINIRFLLQCKGLNLRNSL